MKRALPFAVLFVAFLLWTFPHGLLVERLLKRRLAELDVAVSTGEVALTWPPGYRIERVALARSEYGVSIDSIHLDVFLGGGLSFDADACGGTLRGKLEAEPRDAGVRAREGAGKRLDFVFDAVHPGRCLRLGTIRIDGTFDGELRLVGLGIGSGAIGPLAERGRLIVEARDGIVSGHLPADPERGRADGMPIGEWHFDRAHAQARIERGDLLVERGSAHAEGVEWEVVSARVGPRNGRDVRIVAELRARPEGDSPRSKAVMSLLPRAAADEDGWRRYRLSGTVAAPKLVGLK